MSNGELRAGSTQPFDDGYLGYDPRLSSQRFDSFSNFAESESVNDPAGDDSPIFTSNPIAHNSYEHAPLNSPLSLLKWMEQFCRHRNKVPPLESGEGLMTFDWRRRQRGRKRC